MSVISTSVSFIRKRMHLSSGPKFIVLFFPPYATIPVAADPFGDDSVILVHPSSIVATDLLPTLCDP